MASRNRQFTDGQFGGRKFASSVRERSYQYEPCNVQPVLTGVLGSGDPAGTTGAQGRAIFPGGDVLMHVKGAGQTVLGPWYEGAEGMLNVAGDVANAEGYEYVFNGGLAAVGRHFLEVGVGNPIFARLGLRIETVAGTSDCAFGFRAADAFTANLDDYDDFAVINVQAGDVFIETNTAGAGTVSTDSGLNWLDDETHDVMLIVGNAAGQGDGYTQFFLDGAQISVLPHTFADALVLVPWAFHLQNATTTNIWWDYFEIGEVRSVERAV